MDQGGKAESQRQQGALRKAGGWRAHRALPPPCRAADLRPGRTGRHGEEASGRGMDVSLIGFGTIVHLPRNGVDYLRGNADAARASIGCGA